MTAAERMADIFRRGGIAFDSVWCGCLTGHATFFSQDMARKAAGCLKGAGFPTRGPVESVDYTKEQSNRTSLCPKVRRVWRVGWSFP